MNEFKVWADSLVWVLELCAIAAFALSGILEAAQKRLDAVGVCAVAFLTAFGGGTLRDLLLDQRPFFWERHVEALWGVLGLAMLAMLLMRKRHTRVTEQAILWPDAIGIGLCAATGVQQALALGSPALVAVLMGVIAGIFGGVLRDIVCNEIPNAFRDHRPYALCSFVGGWVYVGLWKTGSPDWVCLMACLAVTTGLRIWALLRHVQIPIWALTKEDESADAGGPTSKRTDQREE